MPDDRAIVDEEHIGDAAKAFEGFVLIYANGLIAQVAARRHDRKAQRGHKQVMQRCIGEQDAQVRVPRRDSGGQE